MTEADQCARTGTLPDGCPCAACRREEEEMQGDE